MRRSTPVSTIKLLWVWGHWGRIDIGYPHALPTARVQSSLHPVGHIPPDVIDIERACCKIDSFARRLLVLKYQWGMSLREIAELIDRSKSTAQRKVDDAEYEIHTAYCRG